MASAWQLHNRKPEILKTADRSPILLHVDGFSDVTVRVEIVCFQNVLLGSGRGQDYDRYRPQIRMGLDLGEYLPPIFARKIQIEQNQVRPGRVGKFTFAKEEVHGLFAVACHVHLVFDAACFQGFSSQAYIAGIILDKQNVYWFSCNTGLSQRYAR